MFSLVEVVLEPAHLLMGYGIGTDFVIFKDHRCQFRRTDDEFYRWADSTERNPLFIISAALPDHLTGTQSAA